MSSFVTGYAEQGGGDRYSYFLWHMQRRAFQKGTPLAGNFELTPYCQLDCKMCYVHLQKNQVSEHVLSTDEWLTLMLKACDAGMLYAKLTGGDCFLHPGFWQLYEALHDRGVLITVLTNGYQLDEAAADRFARKPPNLVQLSVYGANPEAYERLTGRPEAFEKAERALDLMRDRRIVHRAAVTVVKQSKDDLKDTLTHLKSRGVQNVAVSPFTFRAREETQRDLPHYSLSVEEEVEAALLHRSIFGTPVGPYACEAEMEADLASSQAEGSEVPSQGISCGAGRFSFFIRWNGTMLPCSDFDIASAKPLEEGFESAWKRVNQAAREYRMPPQCASCALRFHCFNCAMKHYLETGVSGALSPRVCRESKLLTMHGVYR